VAPVAVSEGSPVASAPTSGRTALGRRAPAPRLPDLRARPRGRVAFL